MNEELKTRQEIYNHNGWMNEKEYRPYLDKIPLGKIKLSLASNGLNPKSVCLYGKKKGCGCNTCRMNRDMIKEKERQETKIIKSGAKMKLNEKDLSYKSYDSTFAKLKSNYKIKQKPLFRFRVELLKKLLKKLNDEDLVGFYLRKDKKEVFAIAHSHSWIAAGCSVSRENDISEGLK